MKYDYPLLRATSSSSTSGYVTVFLLASLCIQLSLFRIGDSRVNYPLTIMGYLVLFPYAVFNIAKMKSRVSTTLAASFSVYASFCFASALWSTDTSASISNATLLFACLLISIGGARYDPVQTRVIFVRICLAVMVLSWVSLVVAPGYALQEKGFWRLRGIMSHEFELGYLAGSSMLLSFAELARALSRGTQERRLILTLVFLFSAATLLATQTRTLLVYAALCAALIMVSYTRGRIRIISIFSLVVLTSIVAISVGYLEDTFSRGESDASLSGRTLIWARTIAEAESRPLLGHGYSSFISPIYDYIWTGNYRPPHAHNTWVMSYFEVGIVGAILVSIYLLSQLFVLRRTKQASGGLSPTFYVALFCTMTGMTSLIFGGKLSPMMAIILILTFQEYNTTKRSLREDRG
ncbi:TPA: O-antigen ligase family protein [Stenotrophomonas maltophilia]